MKTPASSPTRQPQRGSALITVLLFSFVLITLAGSVMQWSLSERRLNARSGYWLQARNAAEAVAEYGCFQVAQAFNSRMNPVFGTGSGQVTISLPPSQFFSGSQVGTTTLDLQAGTITRVPATSLYFVDPADPNNRYDPLVGRYVYRRDVNILSRATVTPPNGGGPPVSAYIEEKVSVRGAPLFAYAIFYSGNDLEVNPLPLMDIWGPVHVNGNMFVGSVGSAAINFHGPVSASGNIFHAWRGVTATAQQGGGMSSNDVNFPTDSTGTALASLKTSGGVWKDSTMGADSSTSGLAALIALVTPARSAAFSQFASQTFHGNLQTAAMGIQSYNPMGFGEVVAVDGSGNPVLATDDAADNGATVGTGAGYGHGYGPHALIEPSMAAAASTDPYKIAKDAIEEQKFANKAGLYIKVQVDALNNLVGNITLYGDPRSAPTGTPASDIGPNGGLKLGTAPGNVVQYIKYAMTGNSTTGNVTAGLYDQHQDKGVNLVQLNMGALKTALTNMTATGNGTVGADIVKADNATKWGVGSANGYDKYVSGSTGWNGGVYVEVTTAAAATTHTAVILSNATVASGSSLVSQVNGVTGLTLATNAPVYILGHFNANGTIGTTGTANSALYPDDYPGTAITASTETPVAIAADAVTILSPDYFGTASGAKTAPTANPASSSALSSLKTKKPDASAATEVAAALISGSNTTTPTASGTQEYSGGVHNMPRFLENWGTGASQKRVAIRGSLVSMYNTRIANGIWASDYYSPPIRQWGFDQLFANGTFPPCIPTVLSYRRVDFTYLANAAAYATEISHL